MRRLIATLMLCAGAAGAQPALDATLGDDVTSFRTGIVCTPVVVGTREAPGTIAGTINHLDEVPDFTVPGQVVPGVIGVSFGSLVRTDEDFILVDMVVTHPPMGPDGVTVQTYTTRIGPDGDAPILYSLEYPEEVVFGDWRFQARAAGRDLFDVTFTVVPPAELPELARICDYVDLLS